MQQPHQQTSRWRVLWCLALLLSVCACSCGDDSQTPLTINFRAMVGDKPFACGQKYDGLGKSKVSFLPYDMRMFIHDVKLIDAAGNEVPFTLKDDGKWQGLGVALLDFEDATGECKLTGNTDLRTIIEGTVPAGVTFKGIQFTVGLPFAQNHIDAFSAPAPLSTTSMFWSWALGYKFFRIDGKVPQNNNKFYRFHIGSMGCETEPGNPEKTLKCSLPNRPVIKLADFVPGTHQITLDVAKMLAEAALDEKTDEPSVGCQAESNNPQCAPVFAAFGMEYKSAALTPETQTVFSLSPVSKP